MSAKKMFLSAFGGLLLAASPGLAFHDSQLDPRIAQPLMAMYEASYLQCQMGDPMSCQYVQQLQGAAQQLVYLQTQCQHGNQQACHQYQLGAGQVFQAFQQFQALAQPDPSFDQLSHQERMRLQQQAFDSHNRQWELDQQADMERNQQYLDNLLR